MTRTEPPGQSIHRITPIAILGVPFDKITMEETVELIEQMIDSRLPHYLATANVNFTANAFRDAELRRILLEADCVLCDGMPLVWASRWLGNPLPERVTGADLVPRLLMEAERKGWRVFFLGGTEESLARAVSNSLAKHPRLQIAGAYAPPFEPLLDMDHADILKRIEGTRTDILFVAFGCPKQEKWIKMHYVQSGVPVTMGVGASIDFLAGTSKRAPVAIQRIGLEWLYRISQEPRRLFARYARDLWIFGFALSKQWWRLRARPNANAEPSDISRRLVGGAIIQTLKAPPCLDVAAVENHEPIWQRALASGCHIIVDLTEVKFIDSTGAGLLERLQKSQHAANRQMVLLAPPSPVRSTLASMRLTDLMPHAPTMRAARRMIARRRAERHVVVGIDPNRIGERLAWHGEIVARTADEVWRITVPYIKIFACNEKQISIDLTDVRFIDSTGVSLMIKMKKLGASLGLEVRFSSPRPIVENAIEILRAREFLFGDET